MPRLGRDQEYKQYGTVALWGGIDLLHGEVLGLVGDRYRSAEFIEFLQLSDRHYPAGLRIRVVLDHHSARFPTEANVLGECSQLLRIHLHSQARLLAEPESFFGKLPRTLLRGIRVSSKAELKARIELYLQEVNQEPVVFKWKYKLETLEAESVAAP
jgi:hypothetical protein